MLALGNDDNDDKFKVLKRRGGGAARPYNYFKIPVYRNIVLELLEIFGKRARTAHLFVDIDMSQVQASRHFHEKHGQHLTLTAYLLKAISLAQLNFPISRTQYLNAFTQITFDEVAAGFTVEREVDGEMTVFFGEIEKPTEKSLEEIGEILHSYSHDELSSLARLQEQMQFARLPALAREAILNLGIIFPSLRLRCQKATFGLSSLGALGINIACGPSVCTSVFGVGKVEERAVVCGNEVKIRSFMTLALSYDQKVMDGGQAAAFLNKTKELLESTELS